MIDVKKIVNEINKYISSDFTENDRITHSQAYHMNEILKNIAIFEKEFEGERPVIGIQKTGFLTKNLITANENLQKDTFMRKNGFGVDVNTLNNTIRISLLDKEGKLISSALYEVESSVEEDVVFGRGNYDGFNDKIGVMKFTLEDTGHVEDLGMPVKYELKFPSFYGSLDKLYVSDQLKEFPSLSKELNGKEILDFDDFNTICLMDYLSKNQSALNDINKEVSDVMDAIEKIDKNRELEKENALLFY